jgi:Cu+-exporting ATPase
MKESISITGMHCSSCVTLLKESLEEIKGVQNVDMEIGKATVDYDENIASLDDLRSIIKEEGFGTK